VGTGGRLYDSALEVVSKPPLGLNPPKADKSLCWTETANPLTQLSGIAAFHKIVTRFYRTMANPRRSASVLSLKLSKLSARALTYWI